MTGKNSTKDNDSLSERILFISAIKCNYFEGKRPTEKPGKLFARFKSQRP